MGERRGRRELTYDENIDPSHVTERASGVGGGGGGDDDDGGGGGVERIKIKSDLDP